jgi:trimeric autotransporter adhesin
MLTITHLRSAVLATALLVLAPALSAQTVCVASVSQLLAAMDSFRQAPDDALVTVKIVRGSYAIGAALGGDNIFPAGHSVKLRLLGGYATGCGSRILNPANTTLDGLNQTNSGMTFFSHNVNAQLLFEGLTFTHIQTPANDYPGATLSLSSGDVAEVRYCRFLHNISTMVVSLESPQNRLVNNLIADNTLVANTNPVIVTAAAKVYWGDPASDPLLYAAHNTIVNNTGGPGLQIHVVDGGSDRISEITNNIVWGSASPQIQLGEVDYGLNALLLNQNIYSSINNPPPSASGNLNSNPQFTAAASGDYTLLQNSPGVNSGGQILFHAAPTQDLVGGPRRIGSAPDRGAFESSFNDLTTSIVTTTADNGNNATPTPGSLRAAVKAANASALPYEIRFNIAGGCPQIINLTAPMLDIVGDVHIDATTQPGWIANSAYGELNATLCLLLNGNSSAGYAFRVPATATSARLDVEGLMFASFSDAAIRLEGGSGHRISGNQFGAIAFTSANGAAIRVTGSSGGARIGGFDDYSAVNLIAGSSTAGIYLDNAAGGSVVGNNVIGFQPNGVLGLGNSIGVFIFNSPGNNVQYNYIGHSISNGITISGTDSSGNIVQNNVIGLSGGPGIYAGNAAAGIGVIFAAHHNTIGASQNGSPSGGSNLIVNSGGSGVWISSSGGNGNRVQANSIFENAGMDIDLAVAGPSANQASNPVSGPNHLQNYPVLTSAVRYQATSTTLLTGTLHSAPNTSFRVDVYFDYLCDSSEPTRATTTVWLGRDFVQTNANGDSSFSFSVAAYPDPDNLGKLGATATSPGGDTSEIGNCAIEVSGALPDLIFGNGFE